MMQAESDYTFSLALLQEASASRIVHPEIEAGGLSEKCLLWKFYLCEIAFACNRSLTKCSTHILRNSGSMYRVELLGVRQRKEQFLAQYLSKLTALLLKISMSR